MSAVRNQAVDVAKGLAITLIVLTHVLRGLAAADLLDSRSVAFRHTDAALYLVHLPVFVLLSGLFVEHGVNKYGGQRYLARRLVDFTWAYFVWTLLQGCVKIGTSSLDNAPLRPRDLLLEFVRPTSQLWFLPFMFLTTLVVVLVAPWRRTRLTLAAPGGVVISLAAWGFQGRYVGTLGWGLLIFSFLGVAVGYERFVTLIHHRRLWVAGLCGLSAYLVINAAMYPTAPTSGGTARTMLSVAGGVIAAFAGTAALSWLGTLLSQTPAARSLAFAGRHSMEIFLAHIIFASGTRIVLEKLGVVAPAVQIAGGICTGLIGPLVLWRLSRYHLGWLFRPPGFLMRLFPGLSVEHRP